MEIERGNLVWSDDKSRLDIARVHEWIAATYWARGIPLEVMQRAIVGSDCFGVYENGQQIAFARLVTDRATFAYLCDVYVDEAHRGTGIAEWLVANIHAMQEYGGLRRWMLATRDAHALYEKLGWTQVTDPKPFMQKYDPDIYSR